MTGKKLLWLATEYTLSDNEGEELVAAIDGAICDEYQVILTNDVELIDARGVRELIQSLEDVVEKMEEGQSA